MQIIEINNDEDSVCCSCCQNGIPEIGTFTYSGISHDYPRIKDEECSCKNCGVVFLLRYHYFDALGHINSFVFTGDINDHTYNWQDQLTPEQKHEISEHLKSCPECNKRLVNAELSDAWLASLIHGV